MDRVLIVDRIAEDLQANAHNLPGIVGQQQLALELRFPEIGQVADSVVAKHFGVDGDGGGAPHVRHRVAVVRVERLVDKLLAEIPEIGQLFLVERQEQALVAHQADKIGGGDDQVVALADQLDLGIHRLVAVVGGDIDLDPGLLGEIGDNLVRDVFGPDIEKSSWLAARSGEARPRQKSGKQGQDFRVFI